MNTLGGGRGIRTPERLTPLTVFKTAGFNHSPIPPIPSYSIDPMLEPSRRHLIAGAFSSLFAPCASAQNQRELILRGGPSPEEAIALRAGPVTLEFEPGLAFVRYVRLGDAEILRGVYAAVRDRAWLTVLPKVTNVVREVREKSFRLTFDADCAEGPIHFLWRGAITGDEDGTIRFAMDGVAKTAFQRNRIGFCVLHPLRECAGKPYRAESPEGQRSDGKFPDIISPHQPVKNLRAITHTVSPGVEAEVRMEGDIFEMEDHRNWTDGNYKTYCTPLERPFPVDVRQGHEIRQSITIRLIGKPSVTVSSRAPEVLIDPSGAPAGKLPPIGVGWAPIAAADVPRLKAASPAHVRVDLHLSRDWRTVLTQASQLNLPLEAALFVTDEAEPQLAEAAKAFANAKVARFLVFHEKESSTSEKWLAIARKTLRGAPVGGGTNVYFTELNRTRPKPEWLDLACYSINPQVHAFDDKSLVENLEPQAATVASARSFLGAKPIAVTPVTLRPRFNPNDPATIDNNPRKYDPRQASLFGAAWTLGSVKYLAESGANSITYYETSGPGGWLDPGKVHPLYHVLADVNEFAGADVIPLRTTEPLGAIALMLRKGNRTRIIAENLTLKPVAVRLRLPQPSERMNVYRMDEHSYGVATKEPNRFRAAPVEKIETRDLGFVLLPYGVMRLDSGGA